MSAYATISVHPSSLHFQKKHEFTIEKVALAAHSKSTKISGSQKCTEKNLVNSQSALWHSVNPENSQKSPRIVIWVASRVLFEISTWFELVWTRASSSSTSWSVEASTISTESVTFARPSPLYVHVYICVSVYTCVCVCVCIRTHVCVYEHVLLRGGPDNFNRVVFTFAWSSPLYCVSIYVYIRVYVWIRVCIFFFLHIYTHICVFARPARPR